MSDKNWTKKADSESFKQVPHASKYQDAVKNACANGMAQFKGQNPSVPDRQGCNPGLKDWKK